MQEPRAKIVVPARAGVAQLVEQLIRNQQVIGSSPIAGSNDIKHFGRSVAERSTRRLPPGYHAKKKEHGVVGRPTSGLTGASSS
jgi:hypothetical protein